VFFTWFFVPLFALARYQVGLQTAHRPSAYLRVSLTPAQRLWNVLVLAGLLGLLALGGYRTVQIMPRLSPMLSGRHLESPPPVPGDLLSGWSQLRAELERRRSMLRDQREALRAEREAIEREWSALEALRARIEAGGGGPPDGLSAAEPHRDQAIAEYNRRLTALRVRVEAYTTRAEDIRRAVAEFNAMLREPDGGPQGGPGELPEDTHTAE
jgi:hypothetical protein